MQSVLAKFRKSACDIFGVSVDDVKHMMDLVSKEHASVEKLGAEESWFLFQLGGEDRAEVSMFDMADTSSVC